MDKQDYKQMQRAVAKDKVTDEANVEDEEPRAAVQSERRQRAGKRKPALVNAEATQGNPQGGRRQGADLDKANAARARAPKSSPR